MYISKENSFMCIANLIEKLIMYSEQKLCFTLCHTFILFEKFMSTLVYNKHLCTLVCIEINLVCTENLFLKIIMCQD